MSSELLPSLIALAGVAVSVLASSYLSARQTKIEIKKLRTELQLAYASKLIDKRIETYPVLYKLISDFQKLIHSGKLTKQETDKFVGKMLEWDSTNAIYMSGHTVKTYTKFRSFILPIVRMTKPEFAESYNTEVAKRMIIEELRKVEIALKQDLGVYIVEFPDIDRNLTTYSEVEELSEKHKN
jgi:hypothetical protein